MKREYFGMLFMFFSVAIILGTDYFFGEEIMKEYLSKFIVVWLFVAFYVGQYSMRFPKAF